MKTIYTILTLLYCLTLSHAGMHGKASDELASTIPISVINKGKSKLPRRDIVVEDYEVTITNNNKKTIYLACSKPKHLSAYIKQRNPLAICYVIQGKADFSHLSGRGLKGYGSLKAIKPNESVKFTAPLPTFNTDKVSGLFSIKLTIYLDEKLSEGRFIYTKALEHNSPTQK